MNSSTPPVRLCDVAELEAIRYLLEEGDAAQTLQRAEQALESFPEDWRLHRLRCQAFFISKNTEELAAATQQLSLCRPPAQVLAHYQEMVAVLLGDFAAAAQIIESSLRDNSAEASADLLMRLSGYWHEAAQWQKSLSCLQQALSIDDGTRINISSLLLTLVNLDSEGLGETSLKNLRATFPANFDLLHAHCRLLLTTGKTAKIRPTIESHTSPINDQDWNKLTSLVSIAGLEYEPRSKEKKEGRKHLIDLLVDGRMDELRGQVNRMPDGLEKRRYNDLLDQMPSEPKRKLIRKWQGSESWQSASSGHASMVAICFTGGQGGALGFPMVLFDRYLAALNIDAIYVRDITREVFLGGVQGLGSTPLHWSKALQHQAVGKPVLAISFSGGSFGLMNLCLHTEVSGALLFSPYTYLHSQNKGHMPARQYLVNKYRDVPNDFAALFADNGAPCPMKVWFGTEDVDGVEQSRHIEGIKNIEVNPVSGANHGDVLFELAGTGELMDILSECIPPSSA